MTSDLKCVSAVCVLVASAACGAETHVVRDGQLVEAAVQGREWVSRNGSVVCSGTGNVLSAKKVSGPGELRVKAVLALQDLKGSAASFVLGGSHFGFCGGTGKPFIEGALFGGKTQAIGDGKALVEDGKEFVFEVVRSGPDLTFLIDGRNVYKHSVGTADLGSLGFRPWRSTMRIEQFSVSGDLQDAPPPPAPPAGMIEQDVFVSGKGRYHTYRIPAIVRSTKGTILAFCEGRKKGGGDSGDIDMLVRRSLDGGQTWLPQQVVWDDSGNCCGNPAPVVDQETGTIWLLSTWNRGDDHEGEIINQTSKDTRRVFVIRSDDDGLTWGAPKEITATTKQKDWTWYATGPCHGIQMRTGSHKGRLVIPCDHIEAETKHYYSHTIHSDDHGETWQLGGSTPQHQVNECTVAELSDGRLMLNMRNYDRSKKARQVAISADGGTTWKDQRIDPLLIEPICQGSLLSLTPPEDHAKPWLLFSNPASTSGRTHMTVRASFDDGRTWAVRKLLHAGGSAYSDLVKTGENEIGCLYEADGYKRIILARFSLESMP